MKLSITVTCIFSLLTGIVTTSLMPMEEGITQNTEKSLLKNLHEIYIKNARKSKELPLVRLCSANKTNKFECESVNSVNNDTLAECSTCKDDVSAVFQKHRNDVVYLYYPCAKKRTPLFKFEEVVQNPTRCAEYIAFLETDPTRITELSVLIKDFDRYGVSVSYSDIFSYLCKRYACERHKALVPKIQSLMKVLSKKKEANDVYQIIYQLVNILYSLNDDEHDEHQVSKKISEKIKAIKGIMKTTVKEYRISSPWDTDLGLFLDDIITAFDKGKTKNKKTLKKHLSAVLDDIKKRWGISSSQEQNAIYALYSLNTHNKKQKTY